MSMFSLTFPPRVLVGGGTIAQVPALLASLGITRPLVVTDAFLAGSALLARLTGPLHAAGFEAPVFADGRGEPDTHLVAAGVARLTAGGFDGLIAFGGGSPMDTAKAMAVLHAGGGALRDWKVPAAADMKALPLICIPTTAGTGSEVSRFTVVTDVDRQPEEKMLILGTACVAAAAVVDYELTLDLPPRATADTGLDALTHALEAYVSRKANPVSDAFALSALALIARALPTAHAEPHDRAAREAVMLGATQAGLAFSNASVALVHGLSRPVGAFFHVPHGLSNAMLLPAVTAFSAAAAPGRYAAAAHAMGWAKPGASADAACAALVEGLRGLNAQLGVPTPRAFGIDAARWRELAPVMAEQALASGSPANNPRQPSATECVDLYAAVFG